MSRDYLDNADEAELLLQLSRGNKLAFDILYEKYWKQVYNTAYKRLNNAGQAQDIAQDIFVQLWIRGTTSLIENLPAYLFVAARNGVFKHMEKESKYAALPEAINNLESPAGGPDANMLHSEFLKAFNAMVDALPAQQRLIFKMRFNEGLSSQEIADRLQISPKTVRNQIGKALATLKDSLILLHLLFLFCQK